MSKESPPFTLVTWWEIVPGREEGATPLLERCIRVYGWSEAYAKRILDAYRDFLEALRFAQDFHSIRLMAPPPVERLWQQHVLDVQQYQQDCIFLVGKLVFYHPDNHIHEENNFKRNERINKTQGFLRLRYAEKEFDEEIWSFQEHPNGFGSSGRRTKASPLQNSVTGRKRPRPSLTNNPTKRFEDMKTPNYGDRGSNRVVVQGAGNPAVNGVYAKDGYFERAYKFSRLGEFGGKTVLFSLFQCNVANNTKHWYISIVPVKGQTGTSADLDFYSAPVTMYCTELPPLSGWTTSNEGLEPPPTLIFKESPVRHSLTNNPTKDDDEKDDGDDPESITVKVKDQFGQHFQLKMKKYEGMKKLFHYISNKLGLPCAYLRFHYLDIRFMDHESPETLRIDEHKEDPILLEYDKSIILLDQSSPNNANIIWVSLSKDPDSTRPMWCRIQTTSELNLLAAHLSKVIGRANQQLELYFRQQLIQRGDTPHSLGWMRQDRIVYKLRKADLNLIEPAN